MNKFTVICFLALIVAISAIPSEPVWRHHPRLRREVPKLEDEDIKKIETDGKAEKSDLKTDASFWYGNYGYYPYAYSYPYYGGYGGYGDYGYGYPYSYGGPSYYHYYYY